MSLFFDEDEQRRFHECVDPALADYKWALAMRCTARASRGGLLFGEDPLPYWYGAYELISDGALHVSLSKPDEVGPWLRSVTLDIVRRSEGEWVGPVFRGGRGDKPSGNLETAHLTWAVSLALDLAPQVFSEGERDEMKAVLRDRAIPMCRRFLYGEGGKTVANWRCVLGAGMAVAGAVLRDGKVLDDSEELFKLNVSCFQADGSYSESFQYGMYAMTALTLHHEALVRSRPALENTLPILSYGKGLPWMAASLLHRKPAEGFGPSPRAWSVNFNDSGALVAPPPDVLLALSVRLKTVDPRLSGLARWIHDHFTPPVPDPGPHDRSSFGFLPRFGWLSLVHLPAASRPMSPTGAGLDDLMAFDNGDVIARDAWGGSTVLAVRGGGPVLNGPGHLHGDMGHFILVHGEERLLADPGHSCYRGLVRAGEVESQSHNTLTFTVPGEDGAKVVSQPITQTGWWRAADVAHRRLVDGMAGPGVDRGARRFLASTSDEIRVTATSFAASYGDPIETCERFWILCGSHAVFVVDHVTARKPITTQWNWVLDNHDGALELKDPLADRIIFRRGSVGMKIFHCGDGGFAETLYGWMHLAYHPLPGQTGEGKAGTAVLARFREQKPAKSRWAVHAMAMDGYGQVAGWHLKNSRGPTVLEGPGARVRFSLRVDEGDHGLHLTEEISGRAWDVSKTERDRWGLRKLR